MPTQSEMRFVVLWLCIWDLHCFIHAHYLYVCTPIATQGTCAVGYSAVTSRQKHCTWRAIFSLNKILKRAWLVVELVLVVQRCCSCLYSHQMPFDNGGYLLALFAPG